MQKGKLIGQGRTAEIYEWGKNQVLKLYRNGFPKVAIDNEYRIGLELWKRGLLVPKVASFVEIDQRFGIVYERINGRTMMAHLSSKPWKIVDEAKKLAELHRAIQITVSAEMPSQKARLKQCITDSELLSDNIKIRLLENIGNLPDSNTLCHGDFHPDNIIKGGSRLAPPHSTLEVLPQS